MTRANIYKSYKIWSHEHKIWLNSIAFLSLIMTFISLYIRHSGYYHCDTFGFGYNCGNFFLDALIMAFDPAWFVLGFSILIGFLFVENDLGLQMKLEILMLWGCSSIPMLLDVRALKIIFSFLKRKLSHKWQSKTGT